MYYICEQKRINKFAARRSVLHYRHPLRFSIREDKKN